MKMRILSLFDESGIMVQPWVNLGVECTILDSQHPEGVTEGNPRRIGADIMTWVPDQHYDAIFAFPPCTFLCRPASQWWPRYGGKEVAVKMGMDLVNRTRDLIEQIQPMYWLIENPTGQIPNYWRKYDDKFHPGEFGGWLAEPGEAYTKETCLWFSPNFPTLERRPAPGPWYTHDKWISEQKKKGAFMGPGAHRAAQRSKTPMGFAYAVFNAIFMEIAVETETEVGGVASRKAKPLLHSVGDARGVSLLQRLHQARTTYERDVLWDLIREAVLYGEISGREYYDALQTRREGANCTLILPGAAHKATTSKSRVKVGGRGSMGPLGVELMRLRGSMAKAAQRIYDSWDAEDDDFGGGGICDEVADALHNVIAGGVPSTIPYEVRDGGQDGDDHAWLVVYNNQELYEVDIPPDVYETGRGYNWAKRPGVTIEVEDVLVTPLNRDEFRGPEFGFDEVGATKFSKEEIMNALAASNHSPAGAGKLLGTSPSTVYAWMKRYEIKPQGGEERRISAVKKSMDSMSPEQRAEASKAAAERNRKRWESMSAEEKQRHSDATRTQYSKLSAEEKAKRAEASRQRWLDLSDEEKERHAENVRNRMLSLPEAEKQANLQRLAQNSIDWRDKTSSDVAAHDEWTNSIRHGYSEMDPEAKEEFRRKMQQSSRSAIQRLSQEEKDARNQRLTQNADTWRANRNRDVGAYEEWVESIRKGWAQMSAEDREEYKQRKREWFASLPPEDKKRVASAIKAQKKRPKIGGVPKWDNPEVKPEELRKLAKKNPKVYSNPNITYEMMVEGAKIVPWRVENNPSFPLMLLESPDRQEALKNALYTGWWNHMVFRLAEPLPRRLAWQLCNHVLPIFEEKYPRDRLPRESLKVLEDYMDGRASLEDLTACQVDLAALKSSVGGMDTMAVVTAIIFAISPVDSYGVDKLLLVKSSAAQAAGYAVTESKAFINAKVQGNKEEAWQGGRRREIFWQTDQLRNIYAIQNPEYRPLDQIAGLLPSSQKSSPKRSRKGPSTAASRRSR